MLDESNGESIDNAGWQAGICDERGEDLQSAFFVESDSWISADV